MQKKKLLVLVAGILLGLGVLLVLGYMYIQRVQTVVDEKARILDNHCIAVNPLLTETKVAYIGSMKSLLASDSAAYISAQYSWIGSAREYIELEKQWITKANTFLQRPDVKWLLDTKSKEAIEWQINMYKTESQGIQQIVSLFDNKERLSVKDLHAKMLQVEQDKHIALQAYNLKFGQVLGQPVLNQFIKQPISQCPEKNYTIPSIQDGLREAATEYFVPGPTGTGNSVQ